MEYLAGGREDAIALLEQGERKWVRRPLQATSANVHLLLDHYYQQGIEFTPRCAEVTIEHEILSFVEGEVGNYPLQGAIASMTALCSAATLLRQLHDVSAGFAVQHANEVWALPTRQPIEVMCHGDYAPYNVALSGDKVCGVFDFDLAHPAPRVWDLAYAVYTWAPFKTHEYDKLGDLAQQIERAAQFCAHYGADESQRSALVGTIIERLETLLDFMFSQAQAGNAQFAQNIADGHHLAYQNDIAYLRKHQRLITQVLINN